MRKKAIAKKNLCPENGDISMTALEDGAAVSGGNDAERRNPDGANK